MKSCCSILATVENVVWHSRSCCFGSEHIPEHKQLCPGFYLCDSTYESPKKLKDVLLAYDHYSEYPLSVLSLWTCRSCLGMPLPTLATEILGISIRKPRALLTPSVSFYTVDISPFSFMGEKLQWTDHTRYSGVCKAFFMRRALSVNFIAARIQSQKTTPPKKLSSKSCFNQPKMFKYRSAFVKMTLTQPSGMMYN